jgi:hypothetical protein
MLDVSSIILLCSSFIFHLSFLDCNLFLLFVCKKILWMRKLLCRFVTYLKQSITFGYNNLAKGVLASLLQCSMILLEHFGSLHCIMPFYKEVHMGPVRTKLNYVCVRPISLRT